MNDLLKDSINSSAFYRHNNDDLESVIILGFDGKGNAWVRWEKDAFVNMVPVNRLEMVKDE